MVMVDIRRYLVRGVNFGVVLGVGVLLVALFLVSPAPTGIGTHRQLIPVPCLFKTALGFRCPSCGFTTSLSHLAHGDIMGSVGAHPLGFFLGVGILLVFFFSILGLVTNRAWWTILEKRWFQNLVLCGIGLYLAVWIVRLAVSF